jgi:predicted nucleic acid-binding protein
LKTVYLDTSAIVEQYVQEAGSDVIAQVYSKARLGDLRIAYSVWNIGEVLGVLDKYHTRGWLGREDYELSRPELLGETMKMLKLRILRVVPVKLARIERGL